MQYQLFWGVLYPWEQLLMPGLKGSPAGKFPAEAKPPLLKVLFQAQGLTGGDIVVFPGPCYGSYCPALDPENVPFLVGCDPSSPDRGRGRAVTVPGTTLPVPGRTGYQVPAPYSRSPDCREHGFNPVPPFTRRPGRTGSLPYPRWSGERGHGTRYLVPWH